MKNTLQTTVFTHSIVFKDKMEAKVDYIYAQEVIRAMKENKFSYPLMRLSGSQIRTVGDIERIIDIQKQKEDREREYKSWNDYIDYADRNSDHLQEDIEEIKAYKEECRAIMKIVSGKKTKSELIEVFNTTNDFRKKSGYEIPVYDL